MSFSQILYKMNKFLFALVLGIISFKGFGQTSNLSIEKFKKLYPEQTNVSPYHNSWTQKHFPKRIKEFMEQPLEFGEIVFIGNSITEGGGDWSSKFGIKHIRNRGIAGDLSDGVLRRLDEITYFKPKAVFILIGINDLFNIHQLEDNPALKYANTVPSPVFVAKNILKITKEIHRKSPHTKIFVLTLLPTRRAFLKKDILILNSHIKQNATKGFYQLVDLYSVFLDGNGDLEEEFTKDGVHLNDKGYQKWVAFEKPLLEQL